MTKNLLVVLITDTSKDQAQAAALSALASSLSSLGASVETFESLDTSVPPYIVNRTGAFVVVASQIANTLKLVRKSSAKVPVFAFGIDDSSDIQHADTAQGLSGYIQPNEDTPDFIARRVLHAASKYQNGIAPPFFKALLNYANDGAYSWHCPGHAGGVAYLKSPVGTRFHDFFGENMLRADVCNAVEDLGQLLDHTGPVAASEKNAARIFNADHLFFVTNGTSTSNKIVWHSAVGPDDI
ncbi:MAG: lysine decarboxylase, partial [Proteobacteria bacterium]